MVISSPERTDSTPSPMDTVGGANVSTYTISEADTIVLPPASSSVRRPAAAS